MGLGDQEAIAGANTAIGGVEHELTVARVQLRRALEAQANADTLQDGLEVCETVDREGAEHAQARLEVKRKLRDYPGIINVLLGRIESLEKTRKELLNKADESNLQSARTIISPDE